MKQNFLKMAAVIAIATMFFMGCAYPDDDAGSGGGTSGTGGGTSSSGGGVSSSGSSGGGGVAYIFEDFSGTGTPAGWSYSNFSRRTSGGVDNSACLGNHFNSNRTTASVTTSLVAMGANPVLSFNYRTTTIQSSTQPSSTPAAANAVLYTIFISTDNGTTWTSLNGWTDVRHVSSVDFARIHVDLSAYANQGIRVRITFTRQTDAYVLLDDIAIGTVPPIFSGAATLAAGTVYNNYSSQMSINTRTYRISNKGASPLTFSGLSTTGGITVTDLPTALAAFDTTTITVEINASDFASYATYSGSFMFNTNDADRPIFTVNATGDVRRAPEGDAQDFSGTGTPAGWSYSNFSRRTSGGVDNSACLGNHFNSNRTTASVTTSLVAMGANPVLSFNYRTTTIQSFTQPSSTPAADGAVRYSVSVSADNGATWTNVLTDVPHVSSADFEEIIVNLPAEYANQVIRARITFARVTDAYVLLNDVAME